MQLFLFAAAAILYANAARAQDTAAYLALLGPEDAVPRGALKVGEADLTGNDLNKNCAYYELLLQAKKQATAAGANALKIVRRTAHSRTRHCDEIAVAFYRVAEPRDVERSFEWNAARPLRWADFLGPARAAAGPAVVAETSCGIAIETNLALSADRVKVFVYNTFDRYESWVKPGKASADVLEHEQGHWNICAIYTNRMQARFDRAHITGATLQSEVPAIYNDVSREYLERQAQYEQETAHGTIADAQRRWTQTIDAELAASFTGRL